MQHDFSAYTVESLERVTQHLATELRYMIELAASCTEMENDQDYKDVSALLTDLISMLSEAKTKSLAFRKGMEDAIDTLKIEANYK